MLSYKGLDITFSLYNERWREMRKICLLHLFSLKQVNSFRPIREGEVSCMIKKISAQSSSGQIINLSDTVMFLSSSIINLSDTVMFLSSSIICRVAVGKRYEESRNGKSRFDELLKEAQELGAGLFVGDYFTTLGWIDKLSGMISRIEKICKDLDQFYQKLIDDHLNMNRPDSMNGDILDLLMSLRD
ncbi:6,7,8-trihydroxycoumarin synthase-like [Henckelia pumila]|uniref:6,7,8-trihydroxycoumarin synthase-like n=1 Tax=Henckelia pumila TaxID=405737 RepID=UPI003C6E0DCE